MTDKIGSTHGYACPRHDDSREREAAGRRDLDHHLFLPMFTDGEVERRDPEGGEKLFHRILGGVDGDDRSGCFRCTPVSVENVHVSVSPSPPRELPAAAIAITSLRIFWRMAGGSLAEAHDQHQRRRLYGCHKPCA